MKKFPAASIVTPFTTPNELKMVTHFRKCLAVDDVKRKSTRKKTDGISKLKKKNTKFIYPGRFYSVTFYYFVVPSLTVQNFVEYHRC